MGRRKLSIVIGLLVGLCLLVSVFGLGAYALLGRGSEAGPSVFITAPLFGDQVDVGDLTMVQATARSAKGVTRVELWVDGVLQAAKDAVLPGGHTPFFLAETWQPDGPGAHTLIVRAYDSAGKSGQGVSLVEALEPQAAGPMLAGAYQVQEGDTLESLSAGFRVPAEELVALNPGVQDPLTPGTELVLPAPPAEAEAEPPEVAEAPVPEPLPGEGPPDPETEAQPPLLISLLPRQLLGIPPVTGTMLEVEALSLEVGEEFDGVYCYFSLEGGDMDRVPREGYLDGLGERRWGINAYLSGDYRRVVAVQEATALDVQVNCLGYRGSPAGGEVFDLGTLVASHPEPDWDGHAIEQNVSGPEGSFVIAYAIWPAGGRGGGGEPGEPSAGPPLVLLTVGTYRRAEVAAFPYAHVNLLWGFEEVPGEIWGEIPDWVDGYLVFRDGNLVHVERDPRTVSFRLDERSGTLPQCGESAEYWVQAYEAEAYRPITAPERYVQSNTIVISGDLTCYRERLVSLTLEELHVYCLWVDCPSPPAALASGGLGPTDEELGCVRGVCDPDDWPSTLLPEEEIAYGHVFVNGTRIHSWHWWSPHGGRRYAFGRATGGYAPFIILSLVPDGSVTISMYGIDNDCTGTDDRFCDGETVLTPEELTAIHESGSAQSLRREFASDGGKCFLTFSIAVGPWIDHYVPPPASGP